MFLWSIYTNMFLLKEIYYKLDSLLKIFFSIHSDSGWICSNLRQGGFADYKQRAL